MSFQLYRAAIAHLPRIVVGVPQTLHVATNGNDSTGDGSLGAPFLTPAAAQAVASPGDTIVFRPGTYDPFEVTINGAAGRPITFSTLPGEEQQAIIEGDLQDHVALGGPGVVQDNTKRDGIFIQQQDHIVIRNLTIRNVWRCGVFVLGGAAGTNSGKHEIRDCLIHDVGASCIRVEGAESSTKIDRSEDGSPRTSDVLITGNDVYFNNIANDFIVSPDTETISVASGCADIDTINNTVGHAAAETSGYGIDYKTGVRGGSIIGNTVRNMSKYGIYLDAARRWVSGIVVKDNIVHDVEIGFVMAREAASGFATYDDAVTADGAADFVQELSDIDAFNNNFSNIELAAIFLQKHPKDGPDGSIDDIRIRFNSVWNAQRTGSTDLNLFGWDDYTGFAPTNIDFVGNVVWNTEGSVSLAQSLPAPAWMNYDDNLTASNPGFFNDTITPADMTLTIGSPAIGTVAASYAASPFNLDINGVSRADPANAGSTAGSVAAFAITLASDGTLEIDNNDGRDFVVDDADDDYDGTYSVTNAALANGPVALKAPVLAGDGTPVAGETLTIVPALFAYEGDDGAVTVAYTTTGTNTVDVTDPDNPTLLVAVADEDSTITVTATATQGANDTDSVSNGVAIPATASSPTVVTNTSMSQFDNTNGASVSFTVDLSGLVSGDLYCIWYGIAGSASVAQNVVVDGGTAVTPIANADSQVDGVYFEYVMPGTGSATATVTVNLSGARSSHIIMSWGVKGGTRDAITTSAVNDDVGTNPISVTPTDASNLIVGAVLARSVLIEDGHSWTGVTSFDTFESAGAYDGVAGSATDVAVAAYNVGFTPDPDSTTAERDFALVAVAYSGA